MRIAQVSPYSWSRPGGVRRHVTGLSQALLDRGHNVEIIAPDGDEAESAALERDRPDVPVHSVGTSVPIHDSGSVVPIALSPAAAARTARLVRSARYDLVHVHEPMIPAVALTAATTAHAPVVGTFHMFAARQRWYRPFAPLARRVIPRLAARIAVSEEARWHVARTAPERYEVIPNGIDVASFAAVHAERTSNRILFVGRAEPRKGLDVLLQAFARLPAHVHLDLAGVSEEELESTDGLSTDLPDRIHALGLVAEDELAELLARAAVLCVPSLQGESFGIVLVEGMAAGTPVVASDVPGYGKVLGDAGVLVPPNDARALAAALDRLLADDEARAALGERSPLAARRYDWAQVVNEVLGVYETALRPVQ